MLLVECLSSKISALAGEIAFLQNAEGSALGPFDCFLLLRGLKTLKLRMDAQQSNASRIAHFLVQHSKVGTVYYPGLASHASYRIQQRQARGGGAILSFTAGSTEFAKRIAERSELFSISVSFGSVHSTLCVPFNMSHASVPAQLKATRGIPEDLLRLSIGIEDPEDLINDLIATFDSL
jgi:cystathionine beta-lyase